MQQFAAAFEQCKAIHRIDELKQVQNAHIVVVGGDGTFHVAINQANLDNNTFSLLPAGSGNDFVTQFSRNTAETLCAKIKANAIQHIDLVKAGDVYSHTVCGIGFEALVSQKANESKNPFPALKFIFPVLRYMFVFKPIKVQIEAENYTYSDVAFMVSMGTGKRAGGGFKLFPDAVNTDGKLDLLVIKKPTFWQKILYVGLVNFGKHQHLKVVDYVQTNYVAIRFSGAQMLNADGDVYPVQSFDAAVLPGKLKLIQ